MAHIPHHSPFLQPHFQKSTPDFSWLRTIRAATVLLFLVCSAFVMLVSLSPFLFFLLRFISIRQSRKAVSFVFGHWLAMWPYLFERVNETKVIFTGEKVKAGERVVVICNHRTEVDWMYIWSLALRKGRIGNVKYVVKGSVKNLPIFGWAFYVLEFLLIDRKWALDERVFANFLSTFEDPADPLWFVIFPEGTDYSEEKCIEGQKYAAEHSLPILKHLLLPRTKGFYACVNQLRDSIDAVYDLTIGYKTQLPVFMDNALGTHPKEVHMHIKRTPISEIPHSETEVSTWLMNEFARKDELLHQFYKEGEFPGDHVEGVLSIASGLLNFMVVFICASIILWLILLPCVWIKVYIGFSCVLHVASTYFNYRPRPFTTTSPKM